MAEAESKAREGRDAAARTEARLRGEAEELREQAAASARSVDALEGKLAAAERASAAAASKHAEQLRHRCGPPESRLGSRARLARRAETDGRACVAQGRGVRRAAVASRFGQTIGA